MTNSPIDPAPAVTPAPSGHQRFLIQRTFPPGALDGLDHATKGRINVNNARHEVRWLHSYANADKTKTFCLYEGPNERAIVTAAEKNGMPVDAIMPVPGVILPY